MKSIKSEKIIIRITPELKEYLKSKSDKLKITVSEYIHLLIRNDMK